MANTPSAMIASFIKMPFVKHHAPQQQLIINNFFLEGFLYYLEIENGLWITYGKVGYKANVSFHHFIDKQLTEKYYFLSFDNYENNFDRYSLGGDSINVSSSSWSFLKLGAEFQNNHFKQEKASNITAFFSEEWFSKNFKEQKRFKDSSIKHFINSNQNYICWPFQDAQLPKQVINIQHAFVQNQIHTSADLEYVNQNTVQLIEVFINIFDTENIDTNHFEITNTNRLIILKVKKHLHENLYTKFEGIEELATKFHISSAKLRADFKLTFGKSIFQYFQEQQMILANEMLKNNKLRIAELAEKFGYENPSKFSAVYKKHFSTSPSKEIN